MSLAPEIYRMTQDRIVQAADAMLGLPIAEFLADIARAEAVGPILDPTLYMRAADNLSRIKRLAHAAQALQRTAREVLREDLGAEVR